MPRQKRNERVSIDSDEEGPRTRRQSRDKFEELVLKLADGMAEMQHSIAHLADTVTKNAQTCPQADHQNSSVGQEAKTYVNKEYISLWRDIGGSSLTFYPGGRHIPLFS